MKREFILLMLLLAIGMGQTYADDYTFLTFTKADGTSQSFEAQGLTITFSGTQATIIGTHGTATLPLETVTKMFFSSTDTPTGINDLQDDAQSSVALYTLSGMYVGTFSDTQAATAGQPAGCYVVRQGKNTHKILVR